MTDHASDNAIGGVEPSAPARPQRVEVLGVPVDCVTMDDVVNFADGWIATGRGCATIIAVNPEKVMRAQEDSALRDLLRRATLCIPDGIGVVWAARRRLGTGIGRVPGSELMPALCGLAARRGYGVFLYGAQEDVSAAAADALRARFPGIRIVGRTNGYQPPEAMPALVERINASGADLLFVALGSPRQEAWLAQHSAYLQVKVAQGVGGTLDVLAGRVARAPRIFLALNLEWFYRLLRQPWRAGRQLALIRFVARVLRS